MLSSSEKKGGFLLLEINRRKIVLLEVKYVGTMILLPANSQVQVLVFVRCSSMEVFSDIFKLQN